MDVDTHPLVLAARRLADDLLAPAAAAVDAGWVPRSHLDALGAAGLLGLAAPADLASVTSGAGAPAPVVRAVTEILAGADLSTWFVQAQHHGPLRALAACGAFADVVRELAAGRLVAGIAFSHLRRWPQRPVRAERHGAGWRFDGTAPWYTGWGLNDVVLLSGVSADGLVVHALLDAVEQPGLAPSALMQTAALQAARTVELTLDGLVVPDERVVGTERVEAWQAGDDLVTVNVNPAVFGLAESALDALRRGGSRRGEPEAVEAADRLAARLADVRRQAYTLLDEVPARERTEARLDLRAQAHRVMVDATTALVVAGAGGSMAAGATAQRKAREALFLLVQAQTRPARAAALRTWG